MRKTAIIAALVFSIAAAAPAATFKDLFNSQTIYWENDNFGVGRKSDRFYTNGAKISVTLTETPTWTTDFRVAFCRKKFKPCGARNMFETAGFTFGQNFYTPQVITIAAPQPNDRPWAGWLYVGYFESFVDSEQKIHHTFETHAGILGPGAGAGATQKFIHNDLGFSRNDPLGWPNQLKNEPTFDFSYRHGRRYGNNTRDFIVEPAVMIGSPQTFAGVGLTARVGWHITGFPVSLIVPAAAPALQPHKFEIYAFAGVNPRWVPFNATLDGGGFNDGPKANGPKRFVNDVRVGVSARYRWFRLTYSVVDRSKEFEVPAGAIETQRFGAFALTIEPFETFRD
jgi:lipid A 3-O-deacylase